jgi:hypothetical protein
MKSLGPDYLSKCVARMLSVVSLLLLTSQNAFATNLILDPGESGTMVPEPYMGGHGFRYKFAEQTGKFIIEDLHSSGAILTRATLDFDGTILGEPSWIVEIGTASGLVNVNEAAGHLVLPPGVGGDGTVESSHMHGPDAGGWHIDGATIVYTDDGLWVITPLGSFHPLNFPPPFPTDPPVLAIFRNQTGGRVDIQSLVPEPSSTVLAALGLVALIGSSGLPKSSVERRKSTQRRFEGTARAAPVVSTDAPDGFGQRVNDEPLYGLGCQESVRILSRLSWLS